MHSSTQQPPLPAPNSKWHCYDEKNRKVVVRVLSVRTGIVTYINSHGQHATLNVELFMSTFEKGA